MVVSANLAQQLPKNLRLAIKKLLHRSETFLRAAFHHVTRQRPGRSRKAQHGHVRPRLLHRAPQRLHQEASLHFRVEQVQFPDVRHGAHWLRQVRPGIAQFKGQAHRFCGNQNIRKNDDGIHAQPPEGLQRYFHGQVRRLADLQKRMFRTNFAVFQQVAPRLPHHPHRKTRHRFATRSSQEQFFPGQSGGLSGHSNYPPRITNLAKTCPPSESSLRFSSALLFN